MTAKHVNSTGFPLSDRFVDQFSDKEFREVFVADHVRTRIAMIIRALREQRGLSQTQLGEKMGKPQSVVSRLEDPDYGKLSVQTLLDVAAAFELPLLIEFPEWRDWFTEVRDFSSAGFERCSFNANSLKTGSEATPKSAMAKAYSSAQGTRQPLDAAFNQTRQDQHVVSDFFEPTGRPTRGLGQRVGYRSQSHMKTLSAIS